VKRGTSVSKQLALEGMRAQLDEMVTLVRQVMKQTRVFRGNTRGTLPPGGKARCRQNVCRVRGSEFAGLTVRW
jgi:hypothetical protein